MSAWVYMLLCADASYYVGCTTALDQRIGQHMAGTFPGYTQQRRPVVVVWNEEFFDIRDAIAVERQLKGWSRAKKAALVDGDWERIFELARRSVRPSRRPFGAPQDDDGGG